jgi:hypothetical protein
MAKDIKSAHTSERNEQVAVADLAAQLGGESPVAIVFFAAHTYDGAVLSRELLRAFPAAAVIGCTTAGELTHQVSQTGSVSLLALGPTKVKRAAGALARFNEGVGVGVKQATDTLGSSLELDLRNADPKRYVGVVLVEGLHMKEEAANEALGNAAPLLSFVGGSAGDNVELKQTRVYYNGEVSDDGAALLLLEVAVPFVIGKTCSFEPMSRPMRVTRANLRERILYELDGRPVLDVYAEAVNTRPSELGNNIFMSHPMGVMIEGKPWIRSPQRPLEDGGLKLYCQLPEGSEVHVMRGTDLVEDTKREIARVRAELNGRCSGGFAFNCMLRRLELDAKNLHGPFLQAFEGLEMAGFHTYGESWLGHINQTLTGLWFA